MVSSSAAVDLGAVFDAHVKAEFVDKDVAATMATMAPDPYLTHVPTLTGGTGRAAVTQFYRDYFVGHWPDDVEVKPLSRTVGDNRVVDELIVSFTHDREMPVYLPEWLQQVGRSCCRMWSSWASTRPVAYRTNTSIGIRQRSWCRSACSTRHGFL